MDEPNARLKPGDLEPRPPREADLVALCPVDLRTARLVLCGRIGAQTVNRGRADFVDDNTRAFRGQAAFSERLEIGPTPGCSLPGTGRAGLESCNFARLPDDCPDFA